MMNGNLIQATGVLLLVPAGHFRGRYGRFFMAANMRNGPSGGASPVTPGRGTPGGQPTGSGTSCRGKTRCSPSSGWKARTSVVDQTPHPCTPGA